jgi:hypothetical protein
MRKTYKKKVRRTRKKTQKNKTSFDAAKVHPASLRL